VAVGIASKSPGSKIILCTDGAANVGVGSIPSDSAFYPKIAQVAREKAVSISVITMEGEDCKLEELGTVADITSGQVEIVDPAQLQSKVVSMLSKEILATNVNVAVHLSHSLRFQHEEKVVHNKTTRELGSATAESDITASFELDEISLKHLQEYNKKVIENETDTPVPLPPFLAQRKSDTAPLGALPIQIQVEYVKPVTKEKVLKVYTSSRPISLNRIEVEEKINSTVVALNAIQRAATMAQKSLYNDARIELVSIVRLLQRSMKTVQNQNDYMGYIVQAEKLDQFMREAQQQQSVMGSKVNTQRDDAASQAMYKMKSVSAKALSEKK